jgi:hypothetical protein
MLTWTQTWSKSQGTWLEDSSGDLRQALLLSEPQLVGRKGLEEKQEYEFAI